MFLESDSPAPPRCVACRQGDAQQGKSNHASCALLGRGGWGAIRRRSLSARVVHCDIHEWLLHPPQTDPAPRLPACFADFSHGGGVIILDVAFDPSRPRGEKELLQKREPRSYDPLSV